MRFSTKAIAIALSIGAGVNMAGPAFAQDGREVAARELVAEALTLSRATEIYQDLRGTVREIWLPIMNDTVAGKIPGGLSSDPADTAMLTKVVAVISYGSKAAEEIEPALASDREKIIADVSQVLAKHFTADEIERIRGSFRLSATRKAFDSVYAASRVITGYNYEETRAAQAFAAWTRDISKRASTNSLQPQTPTPERMAKAQVIVDELVRIGHFDEMVADAVQFAKDVVLKTMPMDQQEALRLQVEQVEFQYRLQKQVMVSAAPAALASYLNDADIDQLQGLVRTPAMSKMFALLFNMEKSVTKLTVQDINAARSYIEEMEKSGKIRERTPDEKQAFEADMLGLSTKWSEKLMTAVSPQTRDGLMKAIAELQATPIPGISASPL